LQLICNAKDHPSMIDLALAVMHHLAILSLILIVGAELALMRGDLTVAVVRRLASIDAGYGISAGVIVIVGVTRVVLGAKGWVFYVHNPYFWGKMATFLVVGLLSIHPTVAFLRWRGATNADATFVPSPDSVAAVRRTVLIEAALLGLIVAFAAAMARYGAF
jgi:putative membrane protein